VLQPILDSIKSPEDLRNLPVEKLSVVAQELRDFIIKIVAAKEGHLGASLGVVDLTIALHYCFNTPNDLLIWDVGHQAYGHKILTGRKNIFDTNRSLKGISGFPKREESIYDAFGTGHSSTSISAMLGMALASQLNGDFSKQHIAVIGDASIASGMAFEALNHAGDTNTNLLVVLNDNAIGIDPSVGALKNYLTQVKKEPDLKTNSLFKNLNFSYYGPIDGHDINALLDVFEKTKHTTGPKLVHVITKKGKGLKQAEEQQVTYHAPGKFNAETGELLQKTTAHLGPKFQDVFGKTLVELAEKNKSIIGITPAMPTGSSLKYMMETYPDRAFDVGIAEQHAVTLAAGMATQGLTVYCTIYSTFLQRAYDQVIHDVCLQNIPVIFCIDRAGIVGQDGPTHHGVFDISYLRCIPNITIAAPSNEIELRNLLYTAQFIKSPIAIRYPRGRGKLKNWQQQFSKITIGKGICLQKGKSIAILAVGTMIEMAEQAVKSLEHKATIGLYQMLFIKPLDNTLLHEIFNEYSHIVTLEEGSTIGGFGSSILEFAAKNNYSNKIIVKGIPDEFVEHGQREELLELIGLSPEHLAQQIEELQ